jgi:hypothetical protein
MWENAPVNCKINKLQAQYQGTGYVKCGARVITATGTVQNEISSLTKEDMLIFWGETNDITLNNSTGGIKQIYN